MNKEEIKQHLKSLHNEIVSNISYPKLQELIKNETYFAGGCFKSLYLNEKVNDYDLYFNNKESVEKFLKIYNTMTDDGFEVLLATQNAITFEFREKIIQFIIKFHDMPYQMISRFDFIHCQNFYNPKDEYLELKEYVIGKKELHYNRRSILPISTMKRMGKFMSQGWIIEDQEIVKIAQAIASHDLKKKDVLKEQVAGLNFSQFEENRDSLFDERHDPERVTRKIVKKLKGEKNVEF